MLLIGNSLGIFGSSILSFVLGIHILKTMNSVLLYSISLIIGPIVSLILLPLLGAIVDKYNKNYIISLSQFFSCVAIIFFIINNINYSTFTSIVILLIILKISDQFLTTTLNSSVISIVSEDEVQSFRSTVQLIQSISMILSPIIAVLIYDKFSLIGVCTTELIAEILALIIFTRIEFRTEQSEKKYEDSGVIELFKEGLNFIFRYKKIVFGLIFVIMINFILGIVNIGLPYIQLNILHLSNKSFAINDSILAIGLLLGSLTASQVKSKYTLNIARYSISIIGILTFLLGLLLTIHLSKNDWKFAFGIYVFLLGFAITVCNILISSWSMIKIPQEVQGRVFSVLNALTQISLPLSMLLFGYLFDIISSMIVLSVSGLCLIIVTVVFPSIFKINLKSDNLE